jgi:hypothetical protein
VECGTAYVRDRGNCAPKRGETIMSFPGRGKGRALGEDGTMGITVIEQIDRTAARRGFVGARVICFRIFEVVIGKSIVQGRERKPAFLVPLQQAGPAKSKPP